jgi:hypothetical protein
MIKGYQITFAGLKRLERHDPHSDRLTRTSKEAGGGPVETCTVDNLDEVGANQLEDVGYNFHTL